MDHRGIMTTNEGLFLIYPVKFKERNVGYIPIVVKITVVFTYFTCTV